MDHEFQLQKLVCSGEDAIKTCRRPPGKKENKTINCNKCNKIQSARGRAGER